MDSLRDAVLLFGGAGLGGFTAAAVYAVAEIRRLRRELNELKASPPAVAQPDILAQAQAEARNRQLAILAATDLADYVSQNFPGASRDIIARIAPHLLDKRVG